VATASELIDSMSIWKPRSKSAGQRPSNLVEYRPQQQFHPNSGFVLLIPHQFCITGCRGEAPRIDQQATG
jgi:hypothetical protein